MSKPVSSVSSRFLLEFLSCLHSVIVTWKCKLNKSFPCQVTFGQRVLSQEQNESRKLAFTSQVRRLIQRFCLLSSASAICMNFRIKETTRGLVHGLRDSVSSQLLYEILESSYACTKCSYSAAVGLRFIFLNETYNLILWMVSL